MGSVWLLVCYEGKNFDVRVTDTDKMQLLDLIDDFRVESTKQNVLIPDTYDIYYKIKNNGRKMDVKDDMSLVHMFASFEGVNTINIWLKNSKNPIKEFALFEDLRRKNEEKKKEDHEKARLEREAIFVEPLMTEVPVVDVVSNKTSYVRIVNTQVSSSIPTAETETPPPHHEVETPLQSNKDTQSTQQFPTSDRFCPDSTPFSTQNSQNKPQQKQSKMAKKTPQTTAKRKGISASKGIKIDDNGDKVGNETGNDNKDNARAKKNSKISFVFVDEDSEDSDDSDYGYDVESDTESESVLEESDEGSEGETSEQVKDMEVSSHPFDATTTVIDENDEINETYLDKIYKNGKMFVPQRWGDIKLRQWMMFTSKSQFLDVLSDYCIQQGFEVIVEKSDKTRVRAECCMTKCTWRVHCGRLPDGLTWAIKILSGDHDKDYQDKPFRGKPILELMDAIRVYSMDKIAERLELAENLNDDEPTPYAKRKVEKNCSLARHCTIVSAGGGEYEVYDGACAFPVNILRGTCSCGKWQISGIPCKHACRAIYENKEEPTSYVHGFFTGLCYKLTYGAHIHPIPDKDQWPTFDFPMVFPPIQAKGIGRPAKNRKRKADEPRKGKRSTTVTCSICKNVGHNARACQGGPTAKAKNVAVAGRKRKQSDVAGSSTSKKKKQKDVADQKKKQSHETAPSGGSGSKVA